ncbi:MAG: hypothetical protein U5M23_04575 [Marinagarivorans sp.]|nr:hypothetical protein [Marinagarivorans sp.]
MKSNKLKLCVAAGLSFTLLSGFSLNDIKKNVIPDPDKCEGKSHESRCKNQEYLKAAAAVVAVSIAAKLIHDMVIDYKTEQVANDKDVAKAYKKQYGEMPKSSTVYEYTAALASNNKAIKAGEPTVVDAAQSVTINSNISAILGTNAKILSLEEKIEIFDNETPDAVINSLTKKVYEGKGGVYKNTFSFTLPAGYPQGVYPIKTTVILDGKPVETTNADMQIVMEVLQDGTYQIALR